MGDIYGGRLENVLNYIASQSVQHRIVSLEQHSYIRTTAMWIILAHSFAIYDVREHFISSSICIIRVMCTAQTAVSVFV